MALKDIFNDVKKSVNKNTPELLIGFGLAGMLTSTILAVKATPKACKMIEEENNFRERRGEPDMSNKEIIKMCWKPYIPAAVGYTVSAACIIGANSVNNKRNAMLAGAYKLSEHALKEYTSKVVEVVGEEKADGIRQAIGKDKVQSTPVGTFVTRPGSTLCYDIYSGQYFSSSINEIERAILTLNHRLMNEGMVSLNELYVELGMWTTKMGNEYGWNIDDGMIEATFSSTLTDDSEPCIVMHLTNRPRLEYDKWS